jgi:hypothetical protein
MSKRKRARIEDDGHGDFLPVLEPAVPVREAKTEPTKPVPNPTHRWFSPEAGADRYGHNN